MKFSPAVLDALEADVRRHRSQSSWDWEADARFARLLGNEWAERRILAACESHAPAAFRYAAVAETGVTKQRLAALRLLLKSGRITADWRGTGPGGLSELGTNRVRVYFPLVSAQTLDEPRDKHTMTETTDDVPT